MGRVSAAVNNETRNRCGWKWQDWGAETKCRQVLEGLSGGAQ